MAAQPMSAGEGEVHRVVNRCGSSRSSACGSRWRSSSLSIRRAVSADHLARFALAAFDGAFVAHQSHPEVTIAELLEHLPAALAAVRRELGRAGR